jgi:hypothetical protein
MAAAAMVIDPPSLHEADIIKTTKVGIALREDQAQKEFTLDTKFDSQPQNTKALLCELTERALDCCWETHGLLTFTVDTINMNLLEDHGKIPLETLIAATDTSRLDMTATGICQMQRAKHIYKFLTQSITSKVSDNLDPTSSQSSKTDLCSSNTSC